MVVAIDITKDDLETRFVQVALTGLTVGTRYDVMRLQYRYLGTNDVGTRMYERELPDRRGLWSSVAHRVGWEASSASHTFRDFECPMRPTRYFVVPSASVGPYEFDFTDGTYPLSRGVMDTETVHWNQDLEDAYGNELTTGHIIVRSTDDLASYASCCVVDIPDLRYVARGQEFPVIGRQYPLYVADTREALRGSVILKVNDLGTYRTLRNIVFPASGRIRPVIFNSGGDSTMLLDDLKVIPLDVQVEPVTSRNADLRYVHIDFVTVDTTAPLTRRIGDNDTLASPPVAQFTISDTTPNTGQWVTLTDTSTGLYDSWEWTLERSANNRVQTFMSVGPHKVRWNSKGKKTVKLRVYGSAQGAHVRTKYVTVG